MEKICFSKTNKYRKQYYKKNKKRILANELRCRKTNPEKYKARVKRKQDYFTYSPERRFKLYKKGAKKRGYTFNLTFNDFLKYWKKPCYYCGCKIDSIGLDRKDNLIGYEKHNVVSCCYKCNLMKLKLNDKEFINKCKKIAKRF